MGRNGWQGGAELDWDGMVGVGCVCSWGACRADHVERKVVAFRGVLVMIGRRR
jgi:hypothetical protein